MGSTASAKFVFTSPYRGGTKQWTTRLHCTGGSWQDLTHFNTWCSNVYTPWLTAIPARTTLVQTVAYNPGSDLPVYTTTVGSAGTQSAGSSWFAPLESCILLRWTTDQRSTKNHPIYLFNYLHGWYSAGATSPDAPDASLVTAWSARAAALATGYSDGTLTRKRAGPNGAVAQSGVCEAWYHHRDFPR